MSAKARDDGPRLDGIESSITASMVCSNINRLCILHLLRKTPNNAMQAEKIASSLRISHRTALYHLDILKDYELVEVREFRRKGMKMLRSVWGLRSNKKRNLDMVFSKINKKVDLKALDKAIASGSATGIPDSKRKK